LDLSSWRVAFNGSEPVRETTLWRFMDAFAPFGFRRTAFYPCYGLAEATLMVTGGCSSAEPVLIESNGENDRTLVGCGRGIDDQQILIVDPSSRTPCASGEVGEVWVTGPSVAAGYWNQPALTDAVFGAQLSDSTQTQPSQSAGAGPDTPSRTGSDGCPDSFSTWERAGSGQTRSELDYLRTGDLGFFTSDGELVITGRLKAVLILGGRKIQAEDIEATLAEGQTAVRPGGLVAISVDAGGEECLVIVQDVNNDKRQSAAELEAVAKSIRTRVADAHQLPVSAVVLTRPGSVPRTSSGKVRRATCREAFLNHQLQTVYEWRATDAQRSGEANRRINP
jgi:acyl-CoA synthetase (AMP-forming)/AMP-acid ligase II